MMLIESINVYGFKTPYFNILKTLRLILGDQLNSKHSWYKGNQDNYVYCLFEMQQETNYVKHHIQKIKVFLLLCARLQKH